MESIGKTLGKRLRMLRKYKGLTQEELGRASGLDYKHIGRIERGDKTASLEAIERLAKALNVEYYELLLPAQFALENPRKDFRVIFEDLENHGSPTMQRFLARVLAAARDLGEM